MKKERYIDSKGALWRLGLDVTTGLSGEFWTINLDTQKPVRSTKQPTWRKIIEDVTPAVGQTWVCEQDGAEHVIKTLDEQIKFWESDKGLWYPLFTLDYYGTFYCIKDNTSPPRVCDCGGAKAHTSHSAWCSLVAA